MRFRFGRERADGKDDLGRERAVSLCGGVAGGDRIHRRQATFVVFGTGGDGSVRCCLDSTYFVCSPLMRFSLRAFLTAIPLLALLLATLMWLVGGLEYGIDDAYAECGAAEMIIGYMERHHGKWPPNWDALRSDFDGGGGRVGGWSFDKYRSRIQIDFDADPTELRRRSLCSEEPTFVVIRATYATGVHFGDGPNRMLYDYFRSPAAKRGAQ